MKKVKKIIELKKVDRLSLKEIAKIKGGQDDDFIGIQDIDVT